MGVMMGARDEDTISSLAGRLARLERTLGADEQQRIGENHLRTRREAVID